MATVNELNKKVAALEERVNKLKTSNSVLRDEVAATKANLDTLVNDLNVRFEDVRDAMNNFRR